MKILLLRTCSSLWLLDSFIPLILRHQKTCSELPHRRLYLSSTAQHPWTERDPFSACCWCKMRMILESLLSRKQTVCSCWTPRGPRSHPTPIESLYVSGKDNQRTYHHACPSDRTFGNTVTEGVPRESLLMAVSIFFEENGVDSCNNRRMVKTIFPKLSS